MDKAREWTDEELKKIIARIRQTYEQAQSEITAKWNDYMIRGQARINNLYSMYVSAPADKKDEMLKRYQDALQNYTLRNRWYRDMANDTAYRLASTNRVALDYLNGRLPEIYRANYNDLIPEVETMGISFTLVDESTVRRLILDGDIKLPYKMLDEAKDIAWNTRQMASSVLQGIIQGESMDKIAKRLLPIVDNNKNAAIRNARTMVTGAENRGRYDRYKQLEDDGLIMYKVWIATPDGRTRDWHIVMDGQEVPVDEDFIDGLGNELAYPGDPDGEPETVYNCRCSMRSHIAGVRGRNGKITYVKDFRTQQSFHESQINAERKSRNG